MSQRKLTDLPTECLTHILPNLSQDDFWNLCQSHRNFHHLLFDTYLRKLPQNRYTFQIGHCTKDYFCSTIEEALNLINHDYEFWQANNIALDEIVSILFVKRYLNNRQVMDRLSQQYNENDEYQEMTVEEYRDLLEPEGLEIETLFQGKNFMSPGLVHSYGRTYIISIINNHNPSDQLIDVIYQHR